jgi:chromosome segregation ATPase
VESQINVEIAQIKEKFQEKLIELCPYPKMFEESQVELREAKQRVEVLESDLKSVMAALGKSSAELKSLKGKPVESLDGKYKKLQCELEMLKQRLATVKASKESLEKKHESLKNELDSLRRDSSKIIAVTKTSAEKNHEILHQHINCLEVQLAQCRASSSLSLAQKDETIKKMKMELATLSSCFQNCQGQIKQLKNQVNYLTSQRYEM